MDRHLTTLKSVVDIAKGKYIIPDFQRGFVWEKKNLKQMLDDISEAQKDGKEKYLLGSIVISHDGKVIDGQQRLTSLKLILLALGEKDADFLGYENRNHVDSFLKRLADDIQKSQVENDDCWQCLSDENWPTRKRNVCESGACNTCNLLREMHAYASGHFNKIDKDGFCSYLKNNVCFIEKRLPEEAGIQHTFEVLNTVGEQLRKEDIAKAKLISEIYSISTSEEICNLFNHAWLLCYDIENDLPDMLNMDLACKIQKASSTHELYELMKDSIEDSNENTSVQINDIIEKVERGEYQPRTRLGTTSDYRSAKYSVCLEPEKLIDIALEDSIGRKIGDIVKSVGDEPIKGESAILDMIKSLLLYRTAFDLVIRRNKGDSAWFFSYNFEYNGEHRERLVKIESMMTVSGIDTSRKLVRTVKKAMDNALSNMSGISAETIIGELERYAMEKASEKLDRLDCGVKTDHFVFHWLDYLLYLAPDESDTFRKKAEQFIFVDTSSVEHFMPQKQLSGKQHSSDWKGLLDSFGNLALITPSSNSRLNNSSPKEKVEIAERRNPESLKYELMLNIAETSGWTAEACMEHGNKMRRLLKNPHNMLFNSQ